MPPQDEEANAEEIEGRASPSGALVHSVIQKEGEHELARPASALAWSGLAAGLSMGFSVITEGLLKSYLPDSDWQPLISKLGYSVGFLIVILGRQQLFTENTLTPIIPLLVHRDLPTLKRVLRLWGVVLASNLVGAAAVAFAISMTSAIDPSVSDSIAQICSDSVIRGPGIIFLRSIFAGWLIALIVWLLPFAETGRVWVIIIITYVIGLGRFTHSVAGSVDALFLVWRGELSFARFIAGFLLPALAGNIIGGVALVAALGHAQAASGKSAEG